MTLPKNKATQRPGKRRFWTFAAVFIAFMLIVDGVCLYADWNRYRSVMAEGAIMMAQALESLIHPEHVAGLSSAQAKRRRSATGSSKIASCG